MKKIFLLFSLALLIYNGFAQPGNTVLSFDGIDQFKLGMSRAEMEKLLNKKFVFKHIGIDERYTETMAATYKGIPYDLDLMGSDQKSVRLDGVSTTSPLFKTKEGIGIGTDQATIINTYEKQLLIISKDQVTLVDIDDLDASIVFSMQNKKVVKITVEQTAMFRDRE
jgi:hypothetical protein